MIGKQYLLASMFFGAVSGLLAMCVRWQLGFPGKPLPVIGHLLPVRPDIVDADGAILPGGYNMLVTMHATLMVFFVIMPLLIGVFGNFLIPLHDRRAGHGVPVLQRTELSGCSFGVSGAGDRLASDSFLRARAVAAAGGWTSYAPLSSNPAYNTTH